MKFIKLLTSAYVGGTMRHPHEGVLHLTDEDAQKLLDNQSGEDVSDDFTTKEDKIVPVDQLTIEPPKPASDGEDHPHQSEVAPTPAAKTPTARKASAAKE